MLTDILYIMSFQDDEDNLQFVPTYYISTIYWQNATLVYPDSNLTDINIGVYRIQNGTGSSGKIAGGVYDAGNSPYLGVKDAIIYARIEGQFKGYSVSANTGAYGIDSLPSGYYELIADRIGYGSQSKYVALANVNLDTINFYFHPIGIRDPKQEIPDSYELYQNFPNPFNPLTTIRFGLPKPGTVSLNVYDITGREVSVLFAGRLNAGTYQAIWDATEFAGGIYFYLLQVMDESGRLEWMGAKKMVLVR